MQILVYMSMILNDKGESIWMQSTLVQTCSLLFQKCNPIKHLLFLFQYFLLLWLFLYIIFSCAVEHNEWIGGGAPRLFKLFLNLFSDVECRM